MFQIFDEFDRNSFFGFPPVETILYQDDDARFAMSLFWSREEGGDLYESRHLADDESHE